MNMATPMFAAFCLFCCFCCFVFWNLHNRIDSRRPDTIRPFCQCSFPTESDAYPSNLAQLLLIILYSFDDEICLYPRKLCWADETAQQRHPSYICDEFKRNRIHYRYISTYQPYLPPQRLVHSDSSPLTASEHVICKPL